MDEKKYALKLLQITRNMHEISVNRSNSFTYVASISSQLVAMCLYASIQKKARASIHLLDIGFPDSVYILTRNIIENLIDLINLINDSEYIRIMEINSNVQELKFLNNSKQNPNNRYTKRALAVFYKDEKDIDNEIFDLKERNRINYQYLSDHANQYGCISSKSPTKEVSIKDKFTLSGMKDEYESIYNIMCRHSHGTIGSLVQFYTIQDDIGQSHVATKKIDFFSYFTICDALTGSMLEAQRQIYKLLEIQLDEDLSKMIALKELMVDIAKEMEASENNV